MAEIERTPPAAGPTACPEPPALASVYLPQACPVPVPVASEPERVVVTQSQASVFFATGRSILSDEGRAAIRALVLRSAGTSVLVSVGHADSTGAASSNLALSEARAQSVVGELVRNGVQLTRVSFAALGDAAPLAPNDTAADRQVNRRVDITMQD